ncbi:carbon-nitrogen hydrolase family protein [Oligoflexia bacterium]|nr:carbon-nitrogen hydrolase family protein [Oligoflexia bacterium]
MKVALVQSKMVAKMEDNLGKSIQFLNEAASKGAELVCFPEMHLAPFFPQFPKRDVSKYVLHIEHSFVLKFQEECKRLGVIAVPNFYLQEGDNHFDASPVINSNGEILGTSKMVHILQSSLYHEQDYYTPSDSGFQVYTTFCGKIGVVICFDRHYPESIRTCALRGAQLIVIPTANIKGEPLELFEWELRVAAMQNGVFIAMCNRVGVEDEMDFCGDSLVVDPWGNVVSKADDKEQILYAKLNLKLIEQARSARPFLELRRPECFDR